MGKWKTHLAAQLDGLPMPFSTFPQAGPLPVLNIIHNVSTFDQDLTARPIAHGKVEQASCLCSLPEAPPTFKSEKIHIVGGAFGREH